MDFDEVEGIEIATKTYGPIENWDVSEVTDLSYLFFENQHHIQDTKRKKVDHLNLKKWGPEKVKE